MGIIPLSVKSNHEPITQPESLEVFDLVRMFGYDFARAIDTSIIRFLNGVIGSNWRYEDVALVRILENPDISGMAYFILYQERPVGRIQHTVNSDGEKITGSICIEIMEEVKREKVRKMDHQQMQDFFNQVFDSGYDAGLKDAAQETKITELVGLEEELQTIRGVGSAKARFISEKVKDFIKNNK